MTNEKNKDPVRKWTFIVLALCIVLFVIYLVGRPGSTLHLAGQGPRLRGALAPQVAGRVLEVNIKNNQLVKAGERLFSIDPGSYELAVQSAEAVLKSSQQSLDAGVSNIEAAKANVESAKANVWRTEQGTTRMRRIREDDPGAISERRIQSAEASLPTARASLSAAVASLESARSALGSTDQNNAQLRQARSSLNNARLNLERTAVYAPQNGLITDLRVAEGNFAAAGAALMTFIAIHDSWIQADMSENNLGNLREGDRVEVAFDVRPGKVFEGTVRQTGYGVQRHRKRAGHTPHHRQPTKLAARRTAFCRDNRL